MSTLAEIEKATEKLPAEQKQELMLFLAARLRAAGAKLPEPRQFSREQTAAWIAEDEADLERFRNCSSTPASNIIRKPALGNCDS
ncbi:MAG: hypothetical protein FJ395_04220 [Verrucomicrobia bacterium]|nr:hypothetical protein [Verrucomicrobiota bacterium]